MIHSAEAEALAVQEASKLISESLITIGDMRIDDKGNIVYKATAVCFSLRKAGGCFCDN